MPKVTWLEVVCSPYIYFSEILTLRLTEYIYSQATLHLGLEHSSQPQTWLVDLEMSFRVQYLVKIKLSIDASNQAGYGA